jgi:glutamate carboxypeptidase
MSSDEATAEILAGIRSWVEIESQTADRDGVNRMIDALQQSYLAIGADTDRIAGRDGLGDHLRVRLPGGGDGPGILILSHVDTVHPKGTLAAQPFRIDGERAFGPGIYDMKGGVYLAFHAARELVRAGRTTPLPVTHLITADEEIGSPTSRDLIRAEGERARYVLVTEPAREGGKIVTARKGVARFRLTTRGRAAHAGARHQDGRSAIREMARLILALEELTDYQRGITVNVGLIAGGTGVNVVPAECRAEVDFRLPSLAAADELLAWMAALTPFDPDLRLTVEGGLDRPPFEKTAPIAALLEHARALAAEIGFALEDTASGGGSDGNFLAADLPVLDGLGVDGMGAHTDHEQLYIASLVPRATLLRRLLETLT